MISSTLAPHFGGHLYVFFSDIFEDERAMAYAVGAYYERVDDYDLEYQGQSEQDVPFWRELVMRYTPQRVLELACGSGRIGIELLHSPGDFALEGLDIASEMLAAYQRKLTREPEATQQRVTLHEG